MWFDNGMKGTVHVFDFLEASRSIAPPPICPVFGGERFLQQLAIDAAKHRWGGEDSDFAVQSLDGNACEWIDMRDALFSHSLFARGHQQLVVVDSADSFVKRYRDRLEGLLEKGPAGGTLLLRVDTWPASTRLYKQIDKQGLQIHCDPPQIARGRSKQRDEARVVKWLMQRARSDYGFGLSPSSAATLIDLTQCHFGQMDQELAKICLYADDDNELEPSAIRQIVGGWPAQTMWSAIDAALEGRAGQAIDLIGQLVHGGEHPLAMFGQIAWSLRRYADVGELVTRDSRLRRRIDMPTTLSTAGFRQWGKEIELAQNRLKQLGRKRVAQLMAQLVEIDQALKLTHSREDRGRLMLEILFVQLSEELSPARR